MEGWGSRLLALEDRAASFCGSLQGKREGCGEVQNFCFGDTNVVTFETPKWRQNKAAGHRGIGVLHTHTVFTAPALAKVTKGMAKRRGERNSAILETRDLRRNQ